MGGSKAEMEATLKVDRWSKESVGQEREMGLEEARNICRDRDEWRRVSGRIV